MAPPKSKVDLYAAIRRDARSGMSYRALMREHGVGFRTVKAALESVWPEPRKRPRPRGTRLDAYKPLIDQMLRVDLDAPRKQRHTVKRIFDRLLDEHGAVEGDLSDGGGLRCCSSAAGARCTWRSCLPERDRAYRMSSEGRALTRRSRT
ncbi:hypothetical protein GCM10010304_82770 [Streptomyces roseoviolaceus]